MGGAIFRLQSVKCLLFGLLADQGVMVPAARPPALLFPDADDGVTAGVAGVVLRSLIPPGEAGIAVRGKLRVGGQFLFELLAQLRRIRHHAARNGFGEVFAHTASAAAPSAGAAASSSAFEHAV